MFVFKQKTAYEMRISDWSSDVCSSDLARRARHQRVFRHYGAGHILERFGGARFDVRGGLFDAQALERRQPADRRFGAEAACGTDVVDEAVRALDLLDLRILPVEDEAGDVDATRAIDTVGAQADLVVPQRARFEANRNVRLRPL